MKVMVLCWSAAVGAGVVGCWWGLAVLVWLGIALSNGSPFRMARAS